MKEYNFFYLIKFYEICFNLKIKKIYYTYFFCKISKNLFKFLKYFCNNFNLKTKIINLFNYRLNFQ